MQGSSQHTCKIHSLSVFVGQAATSCAFTSSDSWVILSPIEQRIKRKIESVGTPLKDWGVNIYRGILTGCNEAFIIDENKRAEILAQCADAAERQRTEQIIRPILRGRDIKRYGYDWANLWLITAHNGYGKVPRIDIDNKYPAVKKWLDEGGVAYNGKLYSGLKQITRRADKGATPYNLRNCAYMDDFSKPKIVWADLARTGNAFIYDDAGFTSPNTTYLIASEDKTFLRYLIGVLNSRVILKYLDWISAKLDETGWRWFKQYVETFPIPSFSKQQAEIAELVDSVLEAKDARPKIDTTALEAQIDSIVYRLYGLTDEEIAVFEQN